MYQNSRIPAKIKGNFNNKLKISSNPLSTLWLPKKFPTEKPNLALIRFTKTFAEGVLSLGLYHTTINCDKYKALMKNLVWRI